MGPGVSSDVLMRSCGSTRLSDLDGPYLESARLEKTRQVPAVLCMLYFNFKGKGSGARGRCGSIVRAD